MNRFAIGFIAGGMVTAIGVSWVLGDKKTKKKLIKNGKQVFDQIQHMKDNF